MNFNSLFGLPLLFVRPINGYIKNYFYIKEYRSQWKKLASKEVIRLDLGSGARKGCDGWITVDLVGADINYDLKNGI